jgi:hypothetical protein
MQITLFTKPKAIVTLLFAAIFLLDANLILTYFGIELNDGGILVARILGAVYLVLGIEFWMIADKKDISERSAILYSFAEIIAGVICLHAAVSGVMNGLGFLLAVAYALFAGGFYLVAKKVIG